MINRREERILKEIQCCLTGIQALKPSNPCDTKAIFRGFEKAVSAARELDLAIFYMGNREYDEAESLVSCALDILGRKPSHILTPSR